MVCPRPHRLQVWRLTRRSDECRRKKIKCDGKQPCTHCTVYSYGKSPCATPPPRPINHTNTPQTAPTTSRPTDGAQPRPSTLRL